jgi:alkanesulfonate monooxygenase SsuD/methylene tetrahydromethanopterin reductase-like flavin-dependent oxidoreductase (luciferase family)
MFLCGSSDRACLGQNSPRSWAFPLRSPLTLPRTSFCQRTRGQLPAPIDDIETYWSAPEKDDVSRKLRRSLVGSPETILRGLESLIEETAADELIVASAIYDHVARLRSYEILADVHKELGRKELGRNELGRQRALP